MECTALQCGEWSVKRKVPSVKCTVWSALCGVELGV